VNDAKPSKNGSTPNLCKTVLQIRQFYRDERLIDRSKDSNIAGRNKQLRRKFNGCDPYSSYANIDGELSRKAAAIISM
jgi:hypothetical protein